MRRKIKKLKARQRIEASEELLYITAGDHSELTIEAADEEAKGPKAFSMTAYTGGAMSVGFGGPVVVDLAGLSITAKSRPILRDHNIGAIVGHTDVISNDGKRIKLTGKLSGGVHAEEVAASAANGFPWQASIGASVDRMVFVDEGESVRVNGRNFTGPVYVARKSRLREVSFVALGADDNTSAKVAASFQGALKMDFEKWLEAQGWDIETLSDSQKSTLEAAFNAASDDDSEPAKPPKVVEAKDDGLDIEAARKKYREEIAAEEKRITEIKAKAKELPSDKADEIVANAIESGASVTDAEVLLLRASRQPAPAPAGHVKESTAAESIQAALLQRANVDIEAKCFQGREAIAMQLPKWLRAGVNDDNRQKYLEGAHKFSDISLFDVCLEAARIDGYNGSERNRQSVIQAAFSGSTLTNIFTTSVNATMLRTYSEIGDSTMGWTSSADVRDFKTNDRIRLAKGGALEKLPRGGEASHTERSDVQESYKIARYARQFVVDEQDIVDDMMDALADIPREMGRAAARLRPDLVYAIILANAALDTDAVALFNDASHSNFNTSAALASATLKAAIADLELMQDNGVNLNLMATHLLAPPTLKHTAAQLLNSSEMRNVGDGTSGDNAEFGTLNTLASMENLKLVVDARLENGVTDPTTDPPTARTGANDHWYLVSNQAHTIEVGYLSGTGRAPTSRSFQLDRGQYGIGWDVKMDIGAKALDYRGMIRNDA